MDRKYKINSAISVFKMVVTFSETSSSEENTINVGVDYLNQRVFFDPPLLDGIDYEDLEQEILVKLRPAEIEAPKIPPELLKRIQDVKKGKYDETGVYK